MLYSNAFVLQIEWNSFVRRRKKPRTKEQTGLSWIRCHHCLHSSEATNLKSKWLSDRWWMPCSCSAVFTVSTVSHKPQKLFTKDVQCHNLKSQAPDIFIRKSEKSSPLLSTPRSLCKNKGSSCKVLWQRKTSQSSYASWEKKKKKFLSERTWWGVWKTGRDLRCLPALSFSVSLISWQKGERSLWNSLTTEK